MRFALIPPSTTASYDLVFTEREVASLLEAAERDPPTWSSLVDQDAESDISPAQRRMLLATCDRLCERLRSEGQDEKLCSLHADLERLAARLRTGG